MFCVIRHPEAGIGTTSTESLDHMRALGWVRVSEFRSQPDDFNLPDFAEAPDLDAPPPAPEPEPASEPEKTTKGSKS